MARYHIFRHFHTVNRHRFFVFVNCCRCGIPWRGLVHDLSKYSPKEFFTSARYYQGTRTPIHAERQEHGYYSQVFVHHAKRNRHHYEYWVDYYYDHIILSPMPYRFSVEYCCDVLSASKVYNGKNFTKDKPSEFFERVKGLALMHPATMAFVSEVLTRYKDTGFKHIHRKDTKKLYQECLAKYPHTMMIPMDIAHGEDSGKPY